MALLSPGGFLAPLTQLTSRTLGGFVHDVHLRRNDEVDVYRGGTSLLMAHRQKSGEIVITARSNTYRNQSCSEGLFRRWRAAERGFNEALDAYLRGVRVRKRWIGGEGAVQQQWAREREPWIPFDREGVLDYEDCGSAADRKTARTFCEVKAAYAKLSAIAKGHRWKQPPKTGTEIDQLAIDSEGRLVLVELKRGNTTDYYTPLQLLQYVWEWHSALRHVRAGLQAVIDARVALGLTPPTVPRLTGDTRAAVGLGEDLRTEEVKRRYEKVLGIVNAHLPPGVGPIETWEFTDAGPRIVADAP